MKIKTNLTILIFCCIWISCNQGPKVVAASSDTPNPAMKESTGIFNDGTSNSKTSELPPPSQDIHSVEILEVLPTSKYVYLRVQENEEEFWIATGKKDVQVGETYLYKNGILKTNFESKEYNRIFEKVYLVSNIVSANHGANQMAEAKSSQEKESKEESEIIERYGSIKIAEIVGNPQKYAGKTVQLSGKCVKVNANIMGRNWIHLKDGSQDDRDLVITSEQSVPEGHVVTMSGIVTLEKDFGAGYMYDIIIENGQIIN